MNPRGNSHAPSPATRQAALRQPARSSRTATPAAQAEVQDKPSPSKRSAWNAPRVEDPPLIRILMKEANRKGHQLQEMAHALDCTYGYVAQLRAGHRKPEHIGQEFADKGSS
jgi:hypothetical protein